MAVLKSKKSFTLVETVTVIIISAICLTPFSILVLNVIAQNIRSQAWATAVSMAEAEMEMVTATRFSALTCSGMTAFSAPFTAYTYQISVHYVNPNALNTSVGQPAGCPSSSGMTTDYKRVLISVNNSISGTVNLVTLVTNDW